MHAFILAAGFGTRLRPLTEKIPKPMLRISSEPLIVHQIRWLKRAGIKEIVINLHHLAHQIEDFLQNGRSFGVNITYSHEDPILETGGGIVQALPFLQSDPFLVLNGDVWTNFDFGRANIPSKSSAHLVLVPKPKNRDLGDFSMVGSYVRRPEKQHLRTFTFSGISYLRHSLFQDCELRPFSLTQDLLFPQLEDDRVTGEVFEGRWIDIGTPETLKEVRLLMS